MGLRRLVLAAVAAAALAGCGARPIVVDSLRGGGNPVLRTRNYVKPELEDLKNRGHTYLAGIRATHRAVEAVCRQNRLRMLKNAKWFDRGAAQIVTERSTLPARPVMQTVRLIDENFDEVQLTRGRYWLEIGITSVTHDRTNVVLREYFEPYDAKSRQWLRRFVPPGYVTKAFFKQLDRRVRVLKNPRMPMWRNW